MKVLAGIVALLISTTAFADHGAIAYSPSTGRIGWANGRASRWSARRAAVNACGVGDCAWKVEESNEFAVIAKGANGRIAVAWNCDLFAAERDAVTACSAVDSDCRWRQWVND
ncbi:MAG TPA: DUF4189 domain-containing protein [Kofleriaceae bacterium]|jgi:serine/threonine-protein kinase